MASRLCNRDSSMSMSTRQDNDLDAIRDYLEVFGFPTVTTGCTLVTLAIVIWTLIVFKELWEAVAFVHALSQLPKGDTKFKPTEDDRLDLISLSWIRLALMTVISGFRICIAIMLLFLGA